MATWQPPIPAGALYSKAARNLGPALPMLAYCYDLVQRDGWFDLSLKDAAGDMEESYQTIKRWWWVLKAGPFFCETVDRGRHGWRVRFKDVWLDWRILRARDQGDPFSRSDEGQELYLEDNQGHFKVISRSDEGQELYLHSRVYGTHDSDQADHDPPPPTQPPRVAGGGGDFDRDIARLFASYGILEAEPLAQVYRDAFPHVTLAELETLCAKLHDPTAGPHAGSRLYRALKHGPPKLTAAAPLTVETYRPPPRAKPTDAAAFRIAMELARKDTHRDTS